MLIEIATGIYLIPARGGNFYLAATESDCIVVDAGMPGRAEMLFGVMGQLGWPLTAISHVLITHADIDHVGSLAAIVAASGATVIAAAPTAEHIQAGTMPKHMPAPIQFVIERFMRYDAVSAAQIDLCATGETLPFLGGLEVIATPGHTADHHAFYAPAADFLFAGDALETRNAVGVPPKMIAWNYETAVRSAKKLLELTPAAIACGHGLPSTSHTAAELTAIASGLG